MKKKYEKREKLEKRKNRDNIRKRNWNRKK